MNHLPKRASSSARLTLLRALSIVSLLGITSVATTAQPAPREPAQPTARAAVPRTSYDREKNIIPYQYVVVLKPNASLAVLNAAKERVKALGGTIRWTYTPALNGFSLKVPADAARAQRILQALRGLPGFDYVEPDLKVSVATVQPPNPGGNPPAGLDRIDQRLILPNPLDGRYTYSETAPNVHVYVIDTGIRATHVEFNGRVSPTSFFSAYGDTQPFDCFGHGTHVAGTIGGATYGVAKAVNLHSVRVLDCNGSGSYSDVIMGVNWVMTNVNPNVPNVANMSLGGPSYPPLNTAITNAIAAKITFVVAAGNSYYANACNVSPAQVGPAITVGATDPSTDTLAFFSNVGPCVDIFAPGMGILSAFNTSDTATKVDMGTSMAAPHVAGAAARHLQNFPLDSPAAVWARIAYDADIFGQTNNWPGIGNLGAVPVPGSPNMLLHWGSLNDGYDDGDPHVTTVDGVHYDFQGAGEFVTLRDGNGMQIQTRQTGVTTAPPASNPYTGLTSCVSVNTAVAARVGTHRISYQPGPNGMQLRVDGALATPGAQGIALGSGGRVTSLGVTGGINVEFPNRTTLSVISNFWQSQNIPYLTLSVNKTPATEGLMGAIAPGSWLPALPNGSSLGAKPASLHQRYVDLHQTFANAWRVTSGTSLFDYAPGASTATFTFAGWPPENPPCVFPKSPPVKPIDRDTAQKLCREVSDKNRFENCVFDVAVTGEAGFVKTYLASQRIEAGGTRTMIGDDRETSPVGAPVKFTALVVRRASGGRGTPAGSVEFLLDGSRTGQPVKLDANGRAVWTTSQLKAGRHHVVARYVPTEGSVFLPSTSFEKLHAVGQPEVQIQ